MSTTGFRTYELEGLARAAVCLNEIRADLSTPDKLTFTYDDGDIVEFAFDEEGGEYVLASITPAPPLEDREVEVNVAGILPETDWLSSPRLPRPRDVWTVC